MTDLLETFRRVKVNSVMLDYRYRRDALYHLNLAYAAMLLKQGFMTRVEHDTIVDGLKKVQARISEEDIRKCDGDIYFLYESELFKTIDKNVAAKLHIGRSRNDMYFTMYRMSLRDAIWQVIDEIIETQKLLEQQVKLHAETVIPYYTYGQPAQPGTWGHYLLSVHEMFAADLERLQHAYKTVNKSAMGSAAGIGTAFKLDKKTVADLLGFDDVIENTVIGNSAVDYFLETISDLGILNTTLSRVSSDMIFFASAECKILDCDRRICGVSSIMPQKKNAAAVELLRSQTEHFNGYMVNAFSSASSTTLFPVHETYFFFERFWDNVHILIDNVRLLRLILELSTVNKERGYRLALDGFTAATGMAEELTVETGEPFTLTHHVVGGMIRTLMDQHRLSIENMTPEMLKDQSQKVLGKTIERTQQQIGAMLDPLASLNAKVTGGTPKPTDTLNMLNEAIRIRARNEEWLKASKSKVGHAYSHLER